MVNGLMIDNTGWAIYSRDNHQTQTIWDDGEYGDVYEWTKEQGSTEVNISVIQDPLVMPEEYLL